MAILWNFNWHSSRGAHFMFRPSRPKCGMFRPRSTNFDLFWPSSTKKLVLDSARTKTVLDRKKCALPKQGMFRPCLTDIGYVSTFKQHELSNIKRFKLCFLSNIFWCLFYQNEMVSINWNFKCFVEMNQFWAIFSILWNTGSQLKMFQK